MFQILQDIPNSKVVWKYDEEDLDMLEAGEEFAECVSVPFDFIPLSN